MHSVQDSPSHFPCPDKLLPQAAPPSFHHNFIFYPLLSQEQSRNRTFPMPKSLLLWGIQPRAVLPTNNWDGQYLPLFCFSPNVHESARFSFAKWSPFFQNWFSSGRGSGCLSLILERDVSVYAWWGQPWDWLPTFRYLGYGLWLVEMQQTHWLIV